MKKYHVIGVGNALVDREFEVSDSFLEAQQLNKSMMTLLDETQQQQLLDELKKNHPLKIQTGGGSAANSLVALSNFGGQAFYCCKIANDEDGHFFRQDLANAGVENRLEQQDNDGHTGKCVVLVTPDAERTMCTFLGITIDFSEDELHLDAVEDSEFLYIEGYLATSIIARQAVQKAIQAARAAGTKIALTFSDTSMVTHYQEGLAEFLEVGIDLLFCNIEEALIYTGEKEIDAALEKLLQQSKEVVITQDKEGAIIGTLDKRIHVPGFQVKAVDTNGAGDMFAGAYLYARTHGMNCAQAGLLASRAASELVTHHGARLPQALFKGIKEAIHPTQ